MLTRQNYHWHLVWLGPRHDPAVPVAYRPREVSHGLWNSSPVVDRYWNAGRPEPVAGAGQEGALARRAARCGGDRGALATSRALRRERRAG